VFLHFFEEKPVKERLSLLIGGKELVLTVRCTQCYGSGKAQNAKCDQCDGHGAFLTPNGAAILKLSQDWKSEGEPPVDHGHRDYDWMDRNDL
jgi:hypothetical protein